MNEEIESLLKKLMVALDRNHHPHTTIIVTSTHAEIVEGVAAITNETLVD